jgi:CheY-like chemotaxis protein
MDASERLDPGPILVVEDEPAVRDALTVLLEREGYEVAAAAEGREALGQLRGDRTGPRRPRLILLDLMMPVMDGFEFRVQQLQDPEIADIPVIVFSGGGDLDRKAGLLAPDAWVAKPVDVPRFLELVRRRCAAGAGAAD